MKKLQKLLPVILIVILGIVAVLSLSACNQNAKTDDTISELQTTIDRNKAELDKKIADLTAKHDKEFETLKQVVLTDEQLLADLKNLYNGKIFQLENVDAENKKAIADLKAEYDAKLKELQNGNGTGSGNGNGADNSEAIAQLKAEYDAKLAKLEKEGNDNKKAIEDLTAEYSAKVEKLENEIAEINATIATNKTALETSIANLTNTYQTKVAEIEALIETIQSTNLTYDEKLAELERKVAELLELVGGETPVCTVTFDSNGGTPVASQTVNKGEKLTRPADPTRNGEGLLFDGWYIEDEKWSFYGHIVTKNITLKAKWVSTNLVYSLSDDGTYYIVTGYTGANNYVSIESSYKGLPVTTIANNAFEDCTILTSIAIPDSVESIGSSAFKNCTNLTNITIPNSVTDIGYAAFSGCRKLAEMTMPSIGLLGSIFGGDKYVGGAMTMQFWEPTSPGATDHATYYIPELLKRVTVTGNKISSSAFYSCSNLTSVIIENSVTNIGKSAFANCSGLTSVYYSSTAEDWANISIGSGNTSLSNATRYYYSEEEPPLNDDGTDYDDNYWHYGDNNEVVIWTKENA